MNGNGEDFAENGFDGGVVGGVTFPQGVNVQGYSRQVLDIAGSGYLSVASGREACANLPVVKQRLLS
jgi:hypothetical protein